MKVAVTGPEGFIGKNLLYHLQTSPAFKALPISRRTPHAQVREYIELADAVIHLAGVNRPDNELEFETGNVELTRRFCEMLQVAGNTARVIYASSIRAEEETPYGKSKRAGEGVLHELNATNGNPVSIYRLPNVFGKWCKPFYNSAVATFCHNIARGQPITVHDANADLQLVYIDDVVQSLIGTLSAPARGVHLAEVEPVYSTTVGQLAETLHSFHDKRQRLEIERVGTGFQRALYATYISYLEPTNFSYCLTTNEDKRGWFAEILKSRDCGQFSVFTSHPGVTRGSHYHHTKVEKFVVVQGQGCFRFRNISTNEVAELNVCSSCPTVVETVPGWAHEIENTGSVELVCLLWANEVFDPAAPDTYSVKV